jgi:hypothetical protein
MNNCRKYKNVDLTKYGFYKTFNKSNCEGVQYIAFPIKSIDHINKMKEFLNDFKKIEFRGKSIIGDNKFNIGINCFEDKIVIEGLPSKEFLLDLLESRKNIFLQHQTN